MVVAYVASLHEELALYENRKLDIARPVFKGP